MTYPSLAVYPLLGSYPMPVPYSTFSPCPTPYVIGLHVWSGTGEDDHGNEVDVYTPPADEAGTQLPVIGWSVPTTDSPALAGHGRVVVDVELLTPPGFPAAPRDLIDLPAGQFGIVGEIRDYATGPFNWVPGGVLNLRRVDG